ncbi:uncharacterized protein LOC119668853 [Teleopsis dalmanni]|uniref:uncharacterized protein LOC119664359 n=1 Tax=Teleopsis dalmanni TaxID=139649 RepID=UPI0018CE444D|nr:uncharacterized protein LOC119664359 [Teleopsis dalmanni]XP_037934447.1 uncharacterized protein LOC119668853 [Teleopsis dalmanni]XP_037934448.1 uncharacterized protein LOC119668853 [Teleopsis dalmanni]
MDDDISSENSVNSILNNEVEDSDLNFAEMCVQSESFIHNMTFPNNELPNGFQYNGSQECFYNLIPNEACPQSSSSNCKNDLKSVGSNPFINFLRDFRLDHKDMAVINAVQCGAAEWRNLETATKLAYFKEAFVANGGNVDEEACDDMNASGEELVDDNCSEMFNEIRSPPIRSAVAKPKRCKKRKRGKRAEKRKVLGQPGRKACKRR